MQRILVTALVLAAAGCGFYSIGGGLSERNGVLYKDGVALPNHRWVALQIPKEAKSLSLEAATGDITLGMGEAAVEVQLFSEVENDGSVALVDGRPVVSSAGGHAVALNGVRGTVPATMQLTLDDGTGEVSLDGLKGAPRLHVKCGTGDILLHGTTLDDVTVESGTGDLKLEDCKLARLEAESGTGDIRLRGTHVTGGLIKSGTGDVILSGQSDIGSTKTELGTGRVRNGD
jgi:hypothetical protein